MMKTAVDGSAESAVVMPWWTSEGWRAGVSVAVVNARVPEEDAVRLRRAVNDGQSCRDWVSLRDYCLRPSTDPYVSDPSASAVAEVPAHLTDVAIFIVEAGLNRDVAAGAAVMPMTQNVRGKLFPMGGIRGVASFPEARRKGYMSIILNAALSFMHENAIPVSTLYPFKASFYERMGYVCISAKRRVEFAPGVFSGLRPPSQLRIERKKAVDFNKEEYVELLQRMQKKTHGLARFADQRIEMCIDWTYKNIPHWVVVVRDRKGIAGILGYRLGPFLSGTMDVDVFAYANIKARTALLSYIGLHGDQMKMVSLVISPEEDFENWVADASFHVSSVKFQPPQMARIISVKHLEGLPVGGPDSLLFDFTLIDPFLALNHRQRFRFGVNQGRLAVQQRTESSPEETEIDVRGLTALVYGVIRSMAELEVRNWITLPETPDGAKAARKAIKYLFPPTPKPFLFENF